MVSPDLGKLESNANSVGCDVKWRNNISGSIFAKLLLHSAFVISIDGDRLIANFLLPKVDLKVVYFILPLKNPFNAIQMSPQLISDIVQGSCFKLNFRLSIAFQASICLQKVGLELTTKIDHVGTQAIEVVFLAADGPVEDLFRLSDHRAKQDLFFFGIGCAFKVFKDVCDQGKKLFTRFSHRIQDLHSFCEEIDDV